MRTAISRAIEELISLNKLKEDSIKFCEESRIISIVLPFIRVTADVPPYTPKADIISWIKHEIESSNKWQDLENERLIRKSQQKLL